MYSRISNHISALDSISRDARYRIEKAMTHWQRHTCVKFVPYDRLKHTNYVTIQKGQWCASKLGMTGGVQPLYLALGCLVRKAFVVQTVFLMKSDVFLLFKKIAKRNYERSASVLILSLSYHPWMT